MPATLINAAAIVVGGLLGLIFRKGLPERISRALLQALGLCVLLIGVGSALKAGNILIVIVSMVLGVIAGELARIEAGLEKISSLAEKRFAGQGFSRGFVTTTLLFCTGSMAVLGSLDAGLTGDYRILLAKSLLDGVSALIFASSLGFGVLFSALPLLLYQGGITLLAAWLRPVLSQEALADMNATGGLMIVALGLSMLDIVKLKVGNMLPALAVPVLIHLILRLFHN